MVTKPFWVILGCLGMIWLASGCDEAATSFSGGTATENEEVTLVQDLSKAGQGYHNYIDSHGKGPENWEAFREFAVEGGADPAALDAVKGAGYQFMWNVDLRSGISMSETVLAQSSSHAARLMLDGSIGGVSRETIELARKSPGRKSSQKKDSAARPAGGKKGDSLPEPSSPMDRAIDAYLDACDEYFEALAQIKDLPSAKRMRAKLRSLDSKFDAAGTEMAKHGMQVDFLAVPEVYRDAVRQVDRRQLDEATRISSLSDSDAINQFFLSQEDKLGPIGPRRTQLRLQEAFNERHGQVADSGQGEPKTEQQDRKGVMSMMRKLGGNPDSMPGDFLPPSSARNEPAQSFSSAHSGSKQSVFRTWTDASGKFRIQARLISQDRENVRLLKDDGQEITVPVAKISSSDRRHLDEINMSSSNSGRTGFAPGDQVEVFWGSRWYPASVLQADETRFQIRYDGYSSNWDEWVGPDRIRPRS